MRNSEQIKQVLLLVFAILALLFGLVTLPQKVNAVESERNTVNIYMFWGEGCPHCAHAKTYLEPYDEYTDYVSLKKYEVYYNATNQKHMQAVGEALGADASGVPFIVVGDKYYAGYSDTTGRAITQRAEYCSRSSCPDSVSAIVGESTPIQSTINTDATQDGGLQSDSADTTAQLDQNSSPIAAATDNPAEVSSENVIDLPIIGELNVAHFSLPVLTAIIGLLDGFNPCAMWALLFIISLLLGMANRKRMWLYGGTFIATSAIVYFAFMVAWLNFFMFIGHIQRIRGLIGVLAVSVGVYYLYDFYRHKTGCNVTGSEKRQIFFAKIRTIVKEKNVWLGLGGIIILAGAVNIVELACSAGLPVLFTGILSSAGLAAWQYYAYMLLYILFFMLDDLIVFGIAMKTMQIVGIDSKYTHITRLVGGILMLVLGLLLIYVPHWLMFG